MSFEFVARNGIISKGNVVVTGSVTATGGIITSGSIIHTGSLNISGSVVVTGSITSTDYIQPQYIAASASVVLMRPLGGTLDFPHDKKTNSESKNLSLKKNSVRNEVENNLVTNQLGQTFIN